MAERFKGAEKQISASVWNAISYLDSPTDYREFRRVLVEQSSLAVWRSILYMDSPTDYREFLPTKRQQAGPSETDLVMLDNSSKASRRHLWSVTILAVLVVFVFLLVFALYKV